MQRVKSRKHDVLGPLIQSHRLLINLFPLDAKLISNCIDHVVFDRLHSVIELLEYELSFELQRYFASDLLFNLLEVQTVYS